MSYDFTENITLEFPELSDEVYAEFAEKDGQSAKGFIIEVAAIHEGSTSNHNRYSKEELEKAVDTWVNPYPKPIILNHDPTSEPVGRVMAAKMDQEDDGTAYTRLQLAITDPAAIEKIKTGRYLTGSVGGKADEALCTICGENWAKASAFSLPCKHARGKTYKGQKAEINLKGMQWREYSWVNMPADARSGVRSMETPAEGEESWVRPARVFAVNMDKEEIFEYSESEDPRNVLASMKRKDAIPVYMQIKGAFLSALAAQESEIEEEEEDILAVTDQLSDDLANTHIEEEEEEEETPEEGATNEPKPLRPQGQEKPHAQDIDPERSTGAPLSRASDDEEVTGEEKEEDSEVDETDLSEQIRALESRVEELQAREVKLSEENARLKTAVKRGIAERVVDAKIALNLLERSDRANQLEEHLKRTASSLADSLRDLASQMEAVPTKRDYTKVPTVAANSRSMASNDVEKTHEPVFTNLEEAEIVKVKTPEDIFVDALMGRRRL